MSTKISTFRGLNNLTDPVRLDDGWLTRADNVNITETGGVAKRQGYAPVLAGATISAFTTADFRRMYIQDGEVIKAVLPDLSTITLLEGVGATPVRWAEFNDLVYFANESADGVITPDNQLLPWRWAEPATPTLTATSGTLPPGQYHVCATHSLPDGRETGSSEAATITLLEGQGLVIDGLALGSNVYVCPANSTVFQFAFVASSTVQNWAGGPDQLGRDLTTFFEAPLPYGVHLIAVWAGRMYAAQYVAELDQTVIWASHPLVPHLWSMEKDFIVVPRRVELLASSGGGLIVGTDKAVSVYQGDKFLALTDYGVVPGFNWTADNDQTYFWTVRGLCTYPDFKNLTYDRVSVAPGVQAGAALVHDEGQRRVVVTLRTGGSAFNSLS